ncbi:MAG: DNA polymerase IV [Ectothiorhodospiraceae bacterium]|nr:DNA polymerase IV [Chromatiales bacterium]MCP5153969.1 DNA polymerase IV [Ectothiorhodospiraceae bacterium]
MLTREGTEPAARTILHVDMDAFYASVEERERPELRGRPVVVGGDPHGRGVVAAANYEARRFGVHSAMPAAQALRLCPHAVFLPSRMSHYARESSRIRELLERYTPLIEPLSLDEAYLDVSASTRLFGGGEAIARRIKSDIRGRTGLVASVGVAPNKLLAKLASDLDKPDGLVVVSPDAIHAVLDPLPVRRLWGVGQVAAARLAELGIETVGELRATPVARLARAFGRQADGLLALANGDDERPVVVDQAAKSISHETTFDRDLRAPRELAACLLALTEQVAARLRRAARRARTVEIKVRYADFRTVTRARSLAEPTDVTATLWVAARGLLGEQLRRRRDPIRLLGMGASGLGRETSDQLDLFAEPVRRRDAGVDALVDAVSGRFGVDALRRAGGLGVRRRGAGGSEDV